MYIIILKFIFQFVKIWVQSQTCWIKLCVLYFSLWYSFWEKRNSYTDSNHVFCVVCTIYQMCWQNTQHYVRCFFIYSFWKKRIPQQIQLTLTNTTHFDKNVCNNVWKMSIWPLKIFLFCKNSSHSCFLYTPCTHLVWTMMIHLMKAIVMVRLMKTNIHNPTCSYAVCNWILIFHCHP